MFVSEDYEGVQENDFKLYLIAHRCQGRRVCKRWSKTFKVSKKITTALHRVDLTVSLPKPFSFSQVQANYISCLDFTSNRKIMMSHINSLTAPVNAYTHGENAWRRNIFPLRVLSLHLAGSSLYSNVLTIFPNVTALDLSYKRGTFFQPPVPNESLAKLRWLKLESTNCVDGNMLSRLVGLEHLHLKYNDNINGSSLSTLTKLTSLNLSYNHTVNDKTLMRFTSLTSLWLDSNSTITDKSVSLLTNLTLLDLEYNENITSGAVAQLTRLVSINLENNALVSLETVQKLPNLKRVKLVHNDLISQDQLDQALKDFK
jgi:hypothetical protein